MNRSARRASTVPANDERPRSRPSQFFAHGLGCLLLMGMAWVGQGLAATATAGKPNIVFIMADDLGWADVGFHQGNAPTPHLDRLARESVELTQYYSAATCSPTRAALMTGRNWSRFGLGGPDNRRALPANTVTLPSALKTLGYETALTGKWHLGSKAAWGPNHYGFEHSYGSLAGGVGPYDHMYKRGEYSVTWHRNHQLITESGHVTDLITAEAVKWVGERKNAPFFLYVPFTAVHLPLKEPTEWLERVPKSIKGDVPRHYAASIMHLDDSVGKILAALDKAGKRANTIVVFTSDNGGSWSDNHTQDYPKDGYPEGKIPASNVPWRGQKANLYEGGIRVATIVNWPGKLRPGKIDQPMQVVDWMPTFSSLTGYRPARDLKWDGMDIWPVVSGQKTERITRSLYWTQQSNSAVRDGDWKLIVHGVAPAADKQPKVELFNLATDPYEKTDLAAKNAGQLAVMKKRLAEVAKADRDAVAEQ